MFFAGADACLDQTCDSETKTTFGAIRLTTTARSELLKRPYCLAASFRQIHVKSAGQVIGSPMDAAQFRLTTATTTNR